jgi:hypothetical protein
VAVEICLLMEVCSSFGKVEKGDFNLKIVHPVVSNYKEHTIEIENEFSKKFIQLRASTL